MTIATATGAPQGPQGEAGEAVRLSRIQIIAAKRLHQSWTQIPQVTHHAEADVTEIETLRRSGWRPDASFLSFQVKAVAGALEKHPVFNASLSSDGESLALKPSCHAGIAIDTPHGLVVGVVRDCDRKRAEEISADIRRLAAKARSKGLSYDEMVGATFTISSLSGFAGTAFSPIINAPNVAILGVSAIQDRPLPDDAGTGIRWRRMLPLSLTYDHRVINGADAGRFIGDLCEMLADPARLADI
jgi:pyruvate dehydrogenase E2 component (dihydrolipoamide acetyltransferase)